ncbi:MAG: tRNA lysidine(34) synthetase TilS, partial [Bosea sp. 12-68-7]
MSAAEQDSRDHPPVGAREAAALFSDLAAERSLLVAVSGGPDSVALLALLADWSREPGRPCLAAATVDHGLRPDSAAEAQGVAALCARLGVTHRTLRWEGDKPRGRLQERARAARYALLAAEAENAGRAVVVTAHTLDDQAETLLMRMARGSGPSGLAGMRGRVVRDGTVLARPLLGVPKTRLIATAQARGLPVIEDPSNGDPRFARARWRALMPLLAAEGLDAERLSLLAGRLARLDAAAAARCKAVLAAVLLPAMAAVLLPAMGAPQLRLNFSALQQEPDEIVLRVVAALLERLGAEAENAV